MKHPVRPAPAPPDPGRGGNYRMQRSATQINKWEDFTSGDPFFMDDYNRSKSVPPDRPNSKIKKVPPPRPPPPKFNQTSQLKQNNVLKNFFSRPSSAAVSSRPAAKLPVRPARNETASSAVGALINFNSPPSSPTPTMSSDGVSVNSFSSDGTSQSSNNNRSRFESGFEDDFDFFGGIPSITVSSPVTSDPWSTAPQDPFSPTRLTALPKAVQKPPALLPKPSVSVKPTIIRAKPARPARRVVDDNITAAKTYLDDDTDWSPPMPSVPPPPLPLEALQAICPGVPPKPKPRQMESLKKPYGIALYDYNATHPDDLSFPANSVIMLVRAVDEEWFVGQLDGREGMFPANFINVMVPLPTARTEPTVTALYAFSPETWNDLEFPEGAKIRVMSRVSADWLYGEYNSRVGQFPATFVDHIPPNLPLRSA